jgi:hypothetical protein
MKHKDIITLLVSGFIGGVASFILSNAIFGAPADRKTEVEVVTPINSEFKPLDERYFNSKSLNPTQLIKINNEKDDEKANKDLFKEN